MGGEGPGIDGEYHFAKKVVSRVAGSQSFSRPVEDHWQLPLGRIWLADFSC